VANGFDHGQPVCIPFTVSSTYMQETYDEIPADGAVGGNKESCANGSAYEKLEMANRPNIYDLGEPPPLPSVREDKPPVSPASEKPTTKPKTKPKPKEKTKNSADKK